MYNHKKADGATRKQNPFFPYASASTPQENLDEVFREQQSYEQQHRRIQEVAAQLKEKYKQYDETCAFIDFLCSLEGIFLDATQQHWGAAQLHRALVDGEVYLMSQNSGIDEKVFRAILEEFDERATSSKQVQNAAQKLMEKYHDCKPCCVFITYIRDMSIAFVQDTEYAAVSFHARKEELIRARMETIMQQQEVTRETLEEIYKEFTTLVHVVV